MASFGNLHYCRLYDLHSGTDLLLDGCTAQVLIADVHALVTISQKFSCSKNQVLPHSISCVYTFGLMRDAAVCQFEMVRSNGTKVEGISKEKQQAKREYEQAVKQGYTASLGQQETGDVFSISVGNIHAGENVVINLKYIQPLIDDEKKDQVKFIFPRTYAQRYGSAPTVNSSLGSTVHQPFQMNITVEQAGTIKGISCPSGHPISLELGPQTPASHSAGVSLTDRSGFLTQDIVLVITAAKLDAPRCFVEPHPCPNHETTALALTFVPRFNIPDVHGGMEYIFLVDRSGSMSGPSMELVREALIVLLRGLPTNGTTFNIFSFGSYATKLWDRSRPYDQSSLEEATHHVDSMDANYGGTEIASALRLVYDSFPKPLDRPVAVFLLTDGGAWDIYTCVEYTLSARTATSNTKTFVRVFSVGIGDGASSDTCESIAQAGGGMAVYVKQGEPLTGKCSRLVRAARTPEIKVNVVWGLEEKVDAVSGKTREKEGSIEDGDGFELVNAGTKSPITRLASSVEPAPVIISLFNLDSDAMDVDPPKTDLHPTGAPLAPQKPNPTLPPPPHIQQSPLPGQIPSMFPGTRTQIYAIIHTPKDDTAANSNIKEVKIQGVVTTTADLVELVIPVSKLSISPTMLDTSVTSNPFPFLHTLTAKALIKDREEGKHAFPVSVSALFEPTPGMSANDSGLVKERRELKDVYLEKDIIRLGTEYNLASRYTSFVAVDRSSEFQAADRMIPNLAADSQPQQRQQSLSGLSGTAMFGAVSASLKGFGGGGQSISSFGQHPSYDHTNNKPFGSRGFSTHAYRPPVPPPPPPPVSAFAPAPAFAFASAFAPAPLSTLALPSLSNSSPLFFGSATESHITASAPSAPPPPPSFSFSAPTSSFFSGPLAEDEDDEDWDEIVPPSGVFGESVPVFGPGSTFTEISNSNPFSSSAMNSYTTSNATARNTRDTQHIQRTPSSLLAAVARLQQWHGGFQLSMALLKLLAIGFNTEPPDNVDAFAQRLKNVLGIDDRDLGATLLASTWLERYTGNKVVGADDDDDETLDMRGKADEWVKGRLGGGEHAEKRLGELKEGILSMLG